MAQASKILSEIDFSRVTLDAMGRLIYQGEDLVEQLRKAGLAVPDDALLGGSNVNACNANNCSQK